MILPRQIAANREVVLQSERVFANAVGAAVLEKPRVSLWMVLVPILLLHFIYRMQQYKQGRIKFDADFMLTRRRALEAAAAAAASGATPELDAVVQGAGLAAALQPAYRTWVAALAQYYGALLAADGETFDALARDAFRDRAAFAHALERLGRAEGRFYAVLSPGLQATEGAAAVIAAIETHSRRLRNAMADRVFG
jgi:hypothetical protein